MQKHSDSKFEFINDEEKSFILHSPDDLDDFVGKNVRIYGQNSGVETFRSAIGTITMDVIEVTAVQVI